MEPLLRRMFDNRKAVFVEKVFKYFGHNNSGLVMLT